MSEPIYPQVHVQLSGQDGNAFFIIGRVTKAMRRADVERSAIDAFAEEAMKQPSYDALLQLVMRTVSWD